MEGATLLHPLTFQVEREKSEFMAVWDVDWAAGMNSADNPYAASSWNILLVF